VTTPVSDTEAGEYQPKHYHVLAQVMSRETNLAIFRRFEDLNYLRLMRLQAEIMEAKVVFEDRCKQDHTENPEFSKSFRALHLSRKPPVKPFYLGDERLQSRYSGCPKVMSHPFVLGLYAKSRRLYCNQYSTLIAAEK
jgi:hypothetical protein